MAAERRVNRRPDAGRLVLVCAAAPRGLRAGRLPADEPLEEAALRRVAAAAAGLARPDRSWTGPGAAARQTASALGLDAVADPALRDLDYGRWAGLALKDVAAAEPDAFARWLAGAAPHAAPHGGETEAALCARVAGWLEARAADAGTAVAVAPAAVLRAALCTILDAGPPAFRRLDVEPLARLDLRSDGTRWTLRIGAGAGPGGLSHSVVPAKAGTQSGRTDV